MAKTTSQASLSFDVEITGVETAAQKWQKFLDELKKTYTTTAQLEKALTEAEHAMRGLEKAGERSSTVWKEQNSLAQGLREVLADLAKEERAVAEEQKAVAKAGDPSAVQKAIKAQEDLVRSYKQQNLTLDQVKAKLNQYRAAIDGVNASDQRNTKAGQDLIRNYSQQVAALQQVESGLIREKRAADESARAHERQNQSIGRLVKQALLWATTSASLYYLYRRLINVIQQTVKDTYDETQQYKNLTSAVDTLKQSVILAIVPSENMLQLMDQTAGTALKASGAILKLGAAIEGFAAAGAAASRDFGMLGGVIAGMTQGNMQMRIAVGALTMWGEQMGLLDSDQEALTAGLARQNEVLQSNSTFMDGLTEANKEAAEATKTLVGFANDFSEGQQEAASDAADAWQDYQDKVADIQKGGGGGSGGKTAQDLAEKIAKINADALKKRLKAEQDYQKRLADVIRQGERQAAQNAKQHELDMRFMAQRFRLEQIQSERMYQYNRRQLIAEGDVLAIDDLDKRYQLERKAAEENYNLQRKQAEAQYALQAEMLADAMQEQIKQLQEALAEQLKDIEENRKEQIDEAEKAAAEETGAGGANRAKELADAKKAYEEQLAAQKEANKKRLQDLATSLAEFALEHKLTADEVVNAWAAAMGEEPAGLRGMTQMAYRDIEAQTTAFQQALGNQFKTAGKYVSENYRREFMLNMKLLEKDVQDSTKVMLEALKSVADMAFGKSPTIPTSPSGRPGVPSVPDYPFFQHGGEMIVSQPTLIGAGEHGAVERVTVQPLSPIGGNINVSWAGGAIPVNGSGFGGADMSTMTGIFNQMLRGFAMEYVRQRSGLHGQRGR